MPRKHQAEQLLRQGMDPSAIARKMGVSFATVVQYLRLRIGEGALRHSDVYFSIPSERRALLQRYAESGGGDRRDGALREELELFNSLRDRRVFAGDMYEYISSTEVALHELAQKTLESCFGPGEDGWWRQGIPKDIRAKCASRREEDDQPSTSLFAYTDLIDLWKVIDKKWPQFCNIVPAEYAKNKPLLEGDLTRLNALRNSVMHPVKRRKWSEDDFQFVKLLHDRFVVPSSHPKLSKNSSATT